MIKLCAVILFVFWTAQCFRLSVGDDRVDERQGNRTGRFWRKPLLYITMPDIQFTFPAFNSQISPTKQYVDLSPNSVIRYTPVYQKQPLPTASNQHFEKILNKIKNFKRKLKNYRRNHLTTAEYAPVPVDPQAITPIAVSAYDFFPVGPEFLNQYLQINHKYEQQSCIYLKISEDSFMKVQCYPILLQTDQVEPYPTYPNAYTEIFSNPDIANVYHTLIPHTQQSYHSSLYDLQLLGSSSGRYGNVPYSYHHQSTPQQLQYSPFTPHPILHHSAPRPPTSTSSSSAFETWVTKYPKPPKVIHANKTTIPLSITFPYTSNGHGNLPDKLTSVPNAHSNRFPVDIKSDATDNDSPTKISLINHAIVPLDIEPTEKLDSDRLFNHPDDKAVVGASTDKLSITVEPSPTPYELYILPGLGITNPWDGTEFTQAPTNTKRTSVGIFGNENAPSTVISEADKSLGETTVRVSETTVPVASYTEQPLKGPEVHLSAESPTEDRVYEPVETEVTTISSQFVDVDRTVESVFTTTDAFESTDSNLKEIKVTTEFNGLITTVENTLITDKSIDTEERILSTESNVPVDSNIDSETAGGFSESESELRILTSTVFTGTDTDISTIALETTTFSETTQEYFEPLFTTMSYRSDPSSTENDLRQLLTTPKNFVDETSTQEIRELVRGSGDSYVTTTSEPDDLRQLLSTTVDNLEITTDGTNDFRQLPTTTVDALEFSTDNSPDDLRELPTNTDHTLERTTDRGNDFRQLPTVSAEKVESTVTIGSATDDLRYLVEESTENFPSTTFYVSRALYDLRRPANTELNNAVSNTDDSITQEATTQNDLRHLPHDHDDIPESTTDDRLTWFTSNLEDAIPSASFTLRSLVTASAEILDQQTTHITPIIKGEESNREFGQLSTVATTQIEGFSEKSIEDNEIIPPKVDGNTEDHDRSLYANKQINVNQSLQMESSSTVSDQNPTSTGRIKLDKNNILSLSSEDIKADYGRRIPLESEENIVKVLEKNSKTGNWEVQFYKVNENNTSVNSEDVDLPRRADVPISDYDGYDNIDSEAGEKYEYDYKVKNNATAEDLEKLSEMLKVRSLLNDKMSKDKTNGRKKRQEELSMTELEGLSSSYEKMKENNSTVLSDIRDITQNNSENNNKTVLNVNYLDDFLKITDQVRKYYEEKTELNRTKRSVLNTFQRRKNISILVEEGELDTSKNLKSRNRRLNGMNLTRTYRQQRYKRDVTMTSITDNSVDFTDNKSTGENIEANTTIKHFPVPKLPFHNGNSNPPPCEGKNESNLVNCLSVLWSKNSKYLNIQTSPNYTDSAAKDKTNVKSFNASLFNFQHKIETTATTAFPLMAFNTQVFGERANKTYIYKHKNTTFIDTRGSTASLLNNSYQLNESQSGLNVTSSSPAPLVTSTGGPQYLTPTSQIPHLKQTSSIKDKVSTFFVNFIKGSLKNNANFSKSNNTHFSASDVYNDTQLSSTNESLSSDRYRTANSSIKDNLKRTINLIKNITSLLRKPNMIPAGGKKDLTNDLLDKVKEPVQNNSYELQFTIGEVINSTSSEVIYVPMYVEMLLMAQVLLLALLLAFFIFLHYADSRFNKNSQFDTSVTYLNNAFESDRICNGLP